jgi:hypothetical protein
MDLDLDKIWGERLETTALPRSAMGSVASGMIDLSLALFPSGQIVT